MGLQRCHTKVELTNELSSYSSGVELRLRILALHLQKSLGQMLRGEVFLTLHFQFGV